MDYVEIGVLEVMPDAIDVFASPSPIWFPDNSNLTSDEFRQLQQRISALPPEIVSMIHGYAIGDIISQRIALCRQLWESAIVISRTSKSPLRHVDDAIILNYPWLKFRALPSFERWNKGVVQMDLAYAVNEWIWQLLERYGLVDEVDMDGGRWKTTTALVLPIALRSNPVVPDRRYRLIQETAEDRDHPSAAVEDRLNIV